ncbi:hypothetical protein B0H11DRAFT_2037780 [Mycena galericulata]|nr:hypothetical protein B0H11DRAFT_2037780 [Mycena galericulata]
MSEQITFYYSRICPACHRVSIALSEAKVNHTHFEIDVIKRSNKPAWFTEKVNPVGQVPAITFGGPQVPADLPSPDSVKLAESLVIVEFIADLHPESSILPKDPVLRARIHYFVDAVSTRFLPAYIDAVILGKGFDALWTALEFLQSRLAEGKKYAVSDEFTAADIAIAPFFPRLEMCFKNDVGAFKAGEGPPAAEILFSSPRFARIAEYYQSIKERESFKGIFDEAFERKHYEVLFAPIRAGTGPSPLDRE